MGMAAANPLALERARGAGLGVLEPAEGLRAIERILGAMAASGSSAAAAGGSDGASSSVSSSYSSSSSLLQLVAPVVSPFDFGLLAQAAGPQGLPPFLASARGGDEAEDETEEEEEEEEESEEEESEEEEGEAGAGAAPLPSPSPPSSLVPPLEEILSAVQACASAALSGKG